MNGDCLPSAKLIYKLEPIVGKLVGAQPMVLVGGNSQRTYFLTYATKYRHGESLPVQIGHAIHLLPLKAAMS